MFEATEKALAKFKAALDAARNSKKTPEQIEKAKELYNSLDPGDRSLLEYIFPEVVESEDERIRKEMIEALKQLDREKSPVDTYQYQEWIAYLEKQKEQKEQKPIRLDDDTEVGLDRALQIVKAAKGNLCGYQSDDGIYECDHAIQTLERILKNGIEQKPIKVYDNMDDLIADAMIDEISKSDMPDSAKHNRIYWINKHKQKHAEWSDEDETMWSNLIGYLEGKVGMLPSGKERYIKWLKERFVKLVYPKSGWKPSEEQMAALNGAWTNFDSTNAILKTLYDDLKKLM